MARKGAVGLSNCEIESCFGREFRPSGKANRSLMLAALLSRLVFWPRDNGPTKTMRHWARHRRSQDYVHSDVLAPTERPPIFMRHGCAHRAWRTATFSVSAAREELKSHGRLTAARLAEISRPVFNAAAHRLNTGVRFFLHPICGVRTSISVTTRILSVFSPGTFCLMGRTLSSSKVTTTL